MSSREARIRCAAWCRDERIDPAGTAGSSAGICCIEWPAPWPADLAGIPALAPVIEATASKGYALQALHPQNDTGAARVAVYHAPAGGGFSSFGGTELDVTPTEVVQAAASLLESPPEGRPGRAVLICTHGRRDVCCGARGTALAAELDRGTAPFPSDVAVHRTSHLGGHRFAPTALILPEGTAWAYLDADTLRRIVCREGPAVAVADRYRGCVGLSSPAVQVLERAVLAEVGWDVLDAARRGRERSDGSVILDLDFPDGTRQRWTGRVVPRRELPLPACGQSCMSGKSTIEWSLLDLTRLV